MHLIPRELYVGEVFFPPMLLNAALGHRRCHDHGR